MDASFASRPGIADRRYRLAANDNEIVIDDATDEPDVEAHSLTRNDNEIVIESLRRFTGDDDESGLDLEGAGPAGLRQR